MKSPHSWLRVIAILAVASLAAHGQQAKLPEPQQQRVIINFLVPIDSNSVNLLLAVVNNQIRAGVKNITIVISSSGGDPLSAFAAYNILRNVPAEITTFNSGSVDSAALLIYCSGRHRYSLPNPARFLLHQNSIVLSASTPFTSGFLEAQLLQLKSINQMLVQELPLTQIKRLSKLRTPY